MIITKKKKRWMEEMEEDIIDYVWCCKEAKKHLYVGIPSGKAYFEKLYIDIESSYSPYSYKIVNINFCPFCGEKIECQKSK